MFDSRSEMFALLAFTAVFVLVVVAVAVLFGDSALTGVLAIVLLAVGCWVYPKVAERVAKR